MFSNKVTNEEIISYMRYLINQNNCERDNMILEKVISEFSNNKVHIVINGEYAEEAFSDVCDANDYLYYLQEKYHGDRRIRVEHVRRGDR